MASIRRSPRWSAALSVPVQGSQQVWLQEDESAWGTLTVAPNPADPATLITRQVKTELGDYRGFYANVRDAILGAAPLAVTPEDGYRVIKSTGACAGKLRERLHFEGGVLAENYRNRVDSNPAVQALFQKSYHWPAVVWYPAGVFSAGGAGGAGLSMGKVYGSDTYPAGTGEGGR